MFDRDEDSRLMKTEVKSVSDDIARENYKTYIKIINTEDGKRCLNGYKISLYDKDPDGLINPKYVELSFKDLNGRVFANPISFYQVKDIFERELKAVLRLKTKASG